MAPVAESPVSGGVLVERRPLPHSPEGPNREDQQRRMLIVSTILVGFLSLITLILFVAVSGVLRFGSGYQGIRPLDTAWLFALAFVLGFLARRGRTGLVSAILIAFFLAAAIATGIAWGAENPYVLLILSLCIVLSGILISARATVVTSLATIAAIVGMAALQSFAVIHPNLAWKAQRLQPEDGIVFGSLLAIIAVISWLANREIERSLLRARSSEASLRAERDSLERVVATRTAELQGMHEANMAQLYQFAEYGRVATGMIHDLGSLLSGVSLNLEAACDGSHPADALSRALAAARRLEAYIATTWESAQHPSERVRFSVAAELRRVRTTLAAYAAQSHVTIQLTAAADATLVGKPIRFYQLVSNLVVNAVDAYAAIADGRRRVVRVVLERATAGWVVRVEDDGSGIDAALLPRMFEPKVSGKTGRIGRGMGLVIAKEIAEQDFGATISVETEAGQGSVFSVLFPLQHGAAR